MQAPTEKTVGLQANSLDAREHNSHPNMTIKSCLDDRVIDAPPQIFHYRKSYISTTC